MIKLIISDFDGVLLDLKEIHYEALNKALLSVGEEFVITPEEHLKIFDGLSTKRKLEILEEIKDLPKDKFDEINVLKQKFTVDLLGDFSKINPDIAGIILGFKRQHYKFYVASNAIRHTVELGLKKLGISHLVDKFYSNEDVAKSKPNPEMYLRCMADAGVSPQETLIIEDSKHGRAAAVKSGAHVCGVDNSFDFNLGRIWESINAAKPEHKIKWAGKSDVTVLIPMAGAGIRFAEAGYKLPKPLIEVNGTPMIQHVVENLNIDAHYVFIVQTSLYEQHNLGTILPLIAPGCTIIQTLGLTEGAACTTLLAKGFINNGKHLIIANCDQSVEWDSNDFMYSMIDSGVDGGILTFKANETKWSYAKTENNYVTEVAEKRVISEDATVGIYYWKRGCDYVKFAEQMIQKNIRVNNEFYVCPVFNEAIKANKKIKTFPAQKMWGLGTPEDLQNYIINYKGK